MTKAIEQEGFIMIHNQYITVKNKKHLSDKELYLYGLLYREMNWESTVKTSLSILSDFTPIKFSSRKVRETNEIKELLLSLMNKNIIQVSNSNGEIIDGSLKAHEGIVVSFVSNAKSKFTQIYFSEFEKFETIREFYIYTLVKRWKNAEYFECNYDGWSELLNCSRHSAIKYIDEAVNKKIIYKNTGDYTEDLIDSRNQKKQSTNQYKVTPFTEEEKSRITKKLEYLEEKESQENEEEVEEVARVFPSSRTIPVDVGSMF